MDTYKKILEGDLAWPSDMRVAMSTQDLVQRLLQQNYTKRLGCMRNGSQDVRLHRYFASMDMPQLLKMKLPAPHVPTVQDNMDTSNFDSFEDVPDSPYVDDGSGWDKDF
jgi:hypothetical protein